MNTSHSSSVLDLEKSSIIPQSEADIAPESETEEQHVPTDKVDSLETQKSAVPDVIPNGGYGWVCVGTIFTINAHTWGMNSVCPPAIDLWQIVG